MVAHGKEIVERLAQKATLEVLRVGSEEKNHLILTSLPLSSKEIEKQFDLSAMPANRRINQLAKAGLLHKNKRGEKITRTKLGDQFLKLIEEIQDDVITEMAGLVR